MAYTKVVYGVDGGVAFIRLNDPDSLNAMSAEMGKELLDALWRAEREARAVVIASAGRSFCSGANLTGSDLDIDNPARDIGAKLDGIFNPIINQMRTAQIPVITAVRGAAAGYGCSLALAGDIIIAAESAVFYPAFSKVGLVPDGGLSYLVTKAIGRPRAMEMLLLSTKLPAATAMNWGLVNRVVPDAQLDDDTIALARKLASGPRSQAIIKNLVWAALDASFETTLVSERMGQRVAGRSSDFVEGVSAFREKRPPSFSGN